MVTQFKKKKKKKMGTAPTQQAQFCHQKMIFLTTQKCCVVGFTIPVGRQQVQWLVNMQPNPNWPVITPRFKSSNSVYIHAHVCVHICVLERDRGESSLLLFSMSLLKSFSHLFNLETFFPCKSNIQCPCSSFEIYHIQITMLFFFNE
jgi:hypothetical protein